MKPRPLICLVFRKADIRDNWNTNRASLAASKTKQMRNGGGFEVVSPLSHMNRHKHEHAGQNKNR